MTNRRLAIAAACTLATACSLPLAEEDRALQNSCGADRGCGVNGVCLSGACVSTRADLGGLLLQVDVPSSASLGVGSSTVLDLLDQGVALAGQDESGLSVSRDIRLPGTEAVELQAAVLDVERLPGKCPELLVPSEEGPTPVRASFQVSPARDVSGLPGTVYQGQTTLPSEPATLQVPPGRYDVYVVPTPLYESARDEEEGADPACLIPPTVVTGYETGQPLTVLLGTPVTLGGSIEGLDLEGWTVDLVDKDRGSVLSTRETYDTPGQSFQLSLGFWLENRSRALIRLSPPGASATPSYADEQPTEPSALPTIVWSLEAVDLDGDLSVGLRVEALQAEPIAVTGSVLEATAKAPIPATLAIQSIKLLNGEFGTNAAFKTTLPTDGAGAFAVSLLPGTYRVFARPNDAPDKAITETQWQLTSSDLGGGRAVLINDKSSLTAHTTLATGEPASSIPTILHPAASDAQGFVKDRLLTLDVVPAAATTLTDDGGSFAIDVDPGVFDLSLRPSDSSGLPWLVRPRVTIVSRQESAIDDLGALAISNPVVLQGRLTAPSGVAVAGALVRAWLPLNVSTSSKPTVIQVAETVTDDAGRYTLRLPASISQ